jgi:hypothetical protein
VVGKYIFPFFKNNSSAQVLLCSVILNVVLSFDMHAVCWERDGVVASRPFLQRISLLDKADHLLYKLENRTKIVMLSSPAGTGKTALVELLRLRHTDDVEFIDLDMKGNRSPFDMVEEMTGFDLETNSLSKDSRLHDKSKLFTVVFEDAQSKFQGQFSSFWRSLAKKPKDLYPSNLNFIIVTTNTVSLLDHSTPVVLASESVAMRLNREDFLLSEEEAYELLDHSVSRLRNTNACWANKLCERCL